MEEIPVEEFEDDFRPNRFAYNSGEGLQTFSNAAAETRNIQLHAAPIRSEQVREFVRQRIEFELTNAQWLVIDAAMSKFWNNRVPGAWICNEDLAGIIFRHCENQRTLISWERILKITNSIWDYLEIKGRLTEH